MKNSKLIISLLGIFAVLSSGLVYAQIKTEFDQANAFYREGKYAEAALLYQGVADQGVQDAAIFYNLGNAYFKVKKVGPAILAYSKALNLNPRNQDIQKNLAFIQSALPYRIPDKRNLLHISFDKVAQYVSYQEVLFLFLVSSILMAIIFCSQLLISKRISWNFILQWIFLFWVTSLFFISAKEMERRFLRPAIVLEKQVEVRYGPSDFDPVAIKLGEGLKVYVMDKREEWSRIWLINTESGWVRNSQIGEVMS